MSLTGATVAFDLDGTLVETAPDLIGTLNVVLADEGAPPLAVGAARHLVGQGVRHMVEHALIEAGLPFHEDRFPEQLDRFLALYRTRIADLSTVFDGVEAALDALADEGALLCVCTNKPSYLSVLLLEKLGLLGRFAVVCGPDRVSARKPAGAHLRETVLAAGGDPARCLMVGDSRADLDTARAIGAPVALVTFGYTPVSARALDADAVFDHFDHLPEIARRLLS